MTEVDARTRLREIALDLFGRQGIRDTSTREILTAAGLKNPSAINYHFGSKARLIEDLVHELYGGQTPVLQRQIDLANRPNPTVEEWTAIAAESSATLISTERGCLMARVWWEYDAAINPDLFEKFLASGNAVATQWLDAVATVLPHLPRNVAIARNITMLRTLEWMIARRAGRMLTSQPNPSLQMTDPDAFRVLMQEVGVAILQAPTTLSDDDIVFGP
jgi:AcrR family transcriptional regulator